MKLYKCISAQPWTLIALLIASSYCNAVSSTNEPASVQSQDAITWIHHSTEWWVWWWNDNSDSPSRQLPKSPRIGLLTTMTHDTDRTSAGDKLAELKFVVKQERASGFPVIPTLNTVTHASYELSGQIRPGYESGSEFQSWFDRDVWSSRAELLEAMVPLAKDGKVLGLDVEPYWEASKGNPRYPSDQHYSKLRTAITPLINVARKHGLTLYVFPGGMPYLWNRVANDMGVDLVMLDERSYAVPDFFGVNEAKYRAGLDSIAEAEQEVVQARMRYVPGFYETALKKPGFMNAMADRGYKETWIFIRRGDPKVHRYDKFLLPEFYDLSPYNFSVDR